MSFPRWHDSVIISIAGNHELSIVPVKPVGVRTVHDARRCLVADGYRFNPGYIRELKAAGLRVLSLDDDGRFDFYAADVVLNQNILANSAMYAKREPYTDLLLGSEYVLLAPEFLAESRTREHPAGARKVLVTMGGSYLENVTKKVFLALLQMEANIEARIVVGSGNPWQDRLQVLAAQRSGFQLERSPANMAALMRWADVAISGAGSTCWELAYLGLPAIVIALSRDQREIARGLAENEVAVELGWHANLSERQISEVLNRLLSDEDGTGDERTRPEIGGRPRSRTRRRLSAEFLMKLFALENIGG